MLYRNILFVAVGGAVGSVARYIANLIISTKKFPLATFTVNLVGSFLIGVLMGYLIKQNGQQQWQLLLVTGFCGGFTTFSAFSWDIIQMFQQQRYALAFIYILSTLILGILSTLLGFWLIKQYV